MGRVLLGLEALNAIGAALSRVLKRVSLDFAATTTLFRTLGQALTSLRLRSRFFAVAAALD